MTGRPDAYIPLYIGDYLADTTHLSTVEHGAYLLLLFHYWNKGSVFAGGGLPDNDRTLANIAKLSPKDWAEHSQTLRDFFTPVSVNGRAMLMQKRMEEVLEHVTGKYQKKMAAIEAANAAKKAAADRLALARADAPASAPPDGDENALQQGRKSKTKTKLPPEETQTPSPSPNQSEISKNLSFNGNRVGKNGRGVTIESQSERLARFQQRLAQEIGPTGWAIVSSAVDPADPGHEANLAICKATAKRIGKGWPHAWH